jgi:hypothetical protein
MRLLKVLCMTAFAAVLFGCAQPPKKQAFNREAAGHIKTVVVTLPPNQESYEAAILGHPGMSFGLVGALIAAADMQGKTNKLTLAINPAEARLQERFSVKLSEGLASAGYSVTTVTLPKDTKDDQTLTLAKKMASGDAVVAINLIGGYWAAGPSTDYFPRVLAKVRTFDAASGGVLYEDTISYGYAMPQSQTIHLASDSRYRFDSIDALTRDPDKTREGLYSGLDAIVAQVVADLKRN